MPGIENVKKGQVDEEHTETPQPIYNPDPFIVEPVILEPDNTRVAMPQEPQIFLDPELRSQFE